MDTELVVALVSGPGLALVAGSGWLARNIWRKTVDKRLDNATIAVQEANVEIAEATADESHARAMNTTLEAVTKSFTAIVEQQNSQLSAMNSRLNEQEAKLTRLAFVEGELTRVKALYESEVAARQAAEGRIKALEDERDSLRRGLRLLSASNENAALHVELAQAKAVTAAAMAVDTSPRRRSTDK